jgi:D-inositol-3-phosphate glycosyltransferase
MRALFLPGYRYPASLREPLTCGDLRYTFNLSRALARAGVSVDVVTRRSPADPEAHELDGVTIHRYVPELSGLFRTSFDVSLRRRRLFKTLAARADVVVANSPLSVEWLDDIPCPLVYVCSGLEDVRNYSSTPPETLQRLAVRLLRDPLKRATWRRARRVNTTAEKEDATLVSLGVPRGKIATIGPSVERDRYAPAPREAAEKALRAETPGIASLARRKIILSVSRFTPAKGLIETLHAFSWLRRQRADVGFIIVGVRHSHRADYFSRVERTISDLGLGADVAVVENVPESRLPLYYALADVTSVFSVGYDPLPTVLIESMSCGTPVVSTAFETRAQAVRHDETGLVVPENDQRAWASAVDRLFDDCALSRRIRNAALADVRERFDADLVGRQYLELFRTL